MFHDDAAPFPDDVIVVDGGKEPWLFCWCHLLRTIGRDEWSCGRSGGIDIGGRQTLMQLVCLVRELLGLRGCAACVLHPWFHDWPVCSCEGLLPESRLHAQCGQWATQWVFAPCGAEK